MPWRYLLARAGRGLKGAEHSGSRDERQARDKLTANNLKVSRSSERRRGHQGTILYADPVATTVVPTNSTVTIRLNESSQDGDHPSNPVVVKDVKSALKDLGVR